MCSQRSKIDVYSRDTDFVTFYAPYSGKRLLNDSISRTFTGYHLICKGEVLTGCGNILLARIESLAALALVLVSSTFFLLCSTLVTPFSLIGAISLNFGSQLSIVSSYQWAQNFTKSSNNFIHITIQIHLIAIPVLFLFISASAINLFLPGVLGVENLFFRTIHQLVEPLGSLKRVEVVAPNGNKVTGSTSKDLSLSEIAKDYIRAHSYKNYLTNVTTSSYTQHYNSSDTYPLMSILAFLLRRL